jgi:Ni,Fe-hydrogenase III large subunit/Ni,Fe-hydrogenase III component G
MNLKEIINSSKQLHGEEVYINAGPTDFKALCLAVHQELKAPVATFFAVDENNLFKLYCAFQAANLGKWYFVVAEVPQDKPEYGSLSREMFSAALFEREMKEMFGLIPAGNPDQRRLSLHDEVWPEGIYPLRKSYSSRSLDGQAKGKYEFKRTEGEGVFEVPVGPVHAGIIGPGHFRFSVAGEPIINLEIRLGFTHRGVEKLFENHSPEESLSLAECVSGDSVFAHTLSFCHAIEKIRSISVPARARYARCLFLELERMYNHVNDIGGIATDVGFSFPAAYASIIKEALLSINEKLSGSRYLKGVNIIGGVSKNISIDDTGSFLRELDKITVDFRELKQMLLSSVSFMDRVDGTGILNKKIAEDVGIVGLAARASGITRDLRKDFPGVYINLGFKTARQTRGDVLSRLRVRMEEFEESIKIIRQCAALITAKGPLLKQNAPEQGVALGYCEGWRGPVLYWIQLNEAGVIDRCKITDPSFHNWQGLSYAASGNIIPDFPLCNKSFDLSYSGNDL